MDLVAAPSPTLLGRLRRSIFGIPPKETDFEYRGFSLPVPRVRERLDKVVGAFVNGYHVAVTWGDPTLIPAVLQTGEPELLGFAVEGAAMGLGILDIVTPWRRDRLASFLEGFAVDHVYLALCGEGWALARLRRPVEPMLERLKPEVNRWLVVDGFGFHEGFFQPRKTLEEQRYPRHVRGYSTKAFDQGLGRSLWFICGADPERLGRMVASFKEERQEDLWSGVGLASAYAGGVDPETLTAVRALAGTYLPALALGASFAAKARDRAGNQSERTELACRTLCGRSAADAVALVDANSVDGPDEADSPLYEDWRKRILKVYEQELMT